MEFLEHFTSYYQSEYKAGYFIGTVVTALLLVGGLLLRKFTHPLSLFNGIAIPLLVTGLFMGIAGNATGYFTHKTFIKKEMLFNKDKKAFFGQEAPKAEKTHRSWFGIRLMWSLVLAAGGLLLLLAKKDYYMGVGIGILIAGVLGHVEEAVSFKRNERYYHAVMEAARQRSAAALPDLIFPGKVPLSKTSFLPHTTNQFSADQPISPKDKIRTEATEKTTSVHELDSLDKQHDNYMVILDKQDSSVVQHLGTLLLDTDHSEISEVAKDKRLNEYNGALLIKKSSQHKRCWLGI